jgi:heme/copper-type cytochrome/quinol oxidase subunit 2
VNWISGPVNNLFAFSLFLTNHSSTIQELFSLYSWQSCFPFYLFDINRFLIIPLWTSFKIIVFSFDVIHSLGFYCFGIKIDAIPGRINLASTLRSLFKGEHRGFCFELCGQGHSSMLIVGLILTLSFVSLIKKNINYSMILLNDLFTTTYSFLYSETDLSLIQPVID